MRARTCSGSQARITLVKRCIMKGTPPLARTSSVPASCSPRKPKNSALRARIAFHQGRATVWMASIPASTRSAQPVMVRPTHTLSRHRRASTVTTSTRLPSTRITKEAKNSDRVVTSPSMRSISSPGVCPL